ncbi:MAG TPA: hypothetical protein VEX13_16470 [Chloroflexia bacterium]|nr:hypothetical protein [Chloroflexia bacterium]
MKSTNDTGLGRVAGLSLSAAPSALIGSLVLWVLLSAVGLLLLKLSPVEVLLLSLAGVILHWVSDVLHQFGHAWAARQTGHPMIGVRLWWLLTSSVYPPDEPQLPRSVHTRRALGGPIASLLVGALAALPLLAIPTGTGPWWLALFFCLDNLLVLGLGAFLPLGFTDGSTLLKLYSKK